MRIASAVAMVALVVAFVACDRGKVDKASESTVTGAPMTAPPPAVPNIQPTEPSPTPETADTTAPQPGTRTATPPARDTKPSDTSKTGVAGSRKPYPCTGNQVQFKGPGRPFCATVCRQNPDCPGGEGCDAVGTSEDRNGMTTSGAKFCSKTKKML